MEPCAFGTCVLSVCELAGGGGNLLIQINMLTKPKWGNLKWRIGPLQTASHIRLDLRRGAHEERLEGAELEQRCSYFPRMSGPGLHNHQMFTTNPAAFSPLLSPRLSLSDFFSLWGPLKQALPVIMHTQFTRGLWSRWNVSSHMIAYTVYSYSTEKAKQRKQGEKNCLDCCQLFIVVF